MTHFRLLEVPLNAEQTAGHAQELADACVKYGEVLEAKKKANSEASDKLKELQKMIDTLSENIKNGFEEKDVECDERRNTEKNVVETIRLDTEEVIETRPFDEEDAQENLLDQEPGEGEEDEDEEGGESE